jgi:hypothetical protein
MPRPPCRRRFPDRPRRPAHIRRSPEQFHGQATWELSSASPAKRQFHQLRARQPSRLGPRLEPLGQQIKLQVACADKSSALTQLVQIREQEVLLKRQWQDKESCPPRNFPTADAFLQA